MGLDELLIGFLHTDNTDIKDHDEFNSSESSYDDYDDGFEYYTEREGDAYEDWPTPKSQLNIILSTVGSLDDNA